MLLTFKKSPPRRRAMSLVEILVVVAVIGIVSAIAIPTVSRIRESAKEAVALRNAKTIAQMSGALAALGVAHVIPDSLGGAEATARLLREGVIVPEGVMEGEVFVIPGLSDEQIEEVGVYLDVKYDKRELRLEFVTPVDENAIYDLMLDSYDAICQIRAFERRERILPEIFSLICFALPG